MCPWPLALGSRLKQTAERVGVWLLTWRKNPTLRGRLLGTARKLRRSCLETPLLLKEARLLHYSLPCVSSHRELWAFNNRHSTFSSGAYWVRRHLLLPFFHGEGWVWVKTFQLPLQGPVLNFEAAGPSKGSRLMLRRKASSSPVDSFPPSPSTF